ncbi:MAG: hypothetical protein GXO71_01485 [Caldiserica bacterium]|nr:hypothetical protein [Caldisericota bacterium]
MFRRLIELWKTSDLLSVAYEKAEEMFSQAYQMFDYALRVLIEKEKEKEDIYKKDQELNALEIDIRRKILEHLSINPSQDINPALTLISLIKDIERIGDYSKNVIELAHRYPEPLSGEYIENIRKIEKKVKKGFELTEEALRQGDKEKGKAVMETHAAIARECELLMEKIIADSSLSTHLAIIYVLLVRYLKRISAHVKNVASSVVNPFPQLDYKPVELEKRDRES